MIMGGRVAVFIYIYIYRYAYISYNPIMCETVCNISETFRDIQRRHYCKSLVSRSWLSWLSQVSLPFRLLCFAWTRNQSEDRELSNAGEVACGCASSIRDLMYSLSSKCIKRNLKAWNLLWSTWASSSRSKLPSIYSEFSAESLSQSERCFEGDGVDIKTGHSFTPMDPCTKILKRA